MALPEWLESAGIAGPSVVTIGTFDGVHLGHQHLIGEVARRARVSGASAVALAFNPRPGEILRPDLPSLYLCSIEERVRRLREAGADAVIVVPFDRELSKMSAPEFSGLLTDHLGMQGLVGGPDLAIGHRREGTPEVLRTIGEELGFDVSVLPGFRVDGEVVRTRTVRSLLAEAELAQTERFLGRRFAAGGTVVRGAGRGSTIGVPTANVETASWQALPANGVYAVFFCVEGTRLPGAGNLGVRPTFDGVGRSLEIHLLDFNGDLYGKSCQVEFVARLRPEARFASVAELVAQIHADIHQARLILT